MYVSIRLLITYDFLFLLFFSNVGTENAYFMFGTSVEQDLDKKKEVTTENYGEFNRKNL